MPIGTLNNSSSPHNQNSLVIQKKPKRIIYKSNINIKTDKYNDYYKEDDNKLYDVSMRICDRKE